MPEPQVPEVQTVATPIEQVEAALAALALSGQALHGRVTDLGGIAAGLRLSAPVALGDGAMDQVANDIDFHGNASQADMQALLAQDLQSLANAIAKLEAEGLQWAQDWATDQAALVGACGAFDAACVGEAGALSQGLQDFAASVQALGAQFSQAEKVTEQAFVAITNALGGSWSQDVSAELGQFVADLEKTHATRIAQSFDAARQGFDQIRSALETSLGDQSGQFEAALRADLLAIGGHLETEMKSRLVGAVQGLLEEAVQRMARDIAQSILLSGIGAQTSATLAPLVPQLVAIKHIADALREAIEAFKRLGFH